MTIEERSPRARIRDAVEEFLDDPGQTGLDQPSLVKRIVNLINDDIGWRDSILADSVTPVVRDVTAQLLSQRRRMALEPSVLTGSTTLTQREIDDFVDRQTSRFEGWLERGVNGRLLNLFEMRKSDLRAARVERGRQVLTGLHVMRLYATLEEGLDNEEQTVGDRFDSVQVARLAATTALPATNDQGLVALFPRPDEVVLRLPPA